MGKNLVHIKTLSNKAEDANVILKKEEAYIAFLKKKIGSVKVTDNNSKEKAIAVQKAIKSKINQWKEERMDFTRSLDEIKTIFTTKEKEIYGFVETLEEELTKYATKLHKEQKKREEEHRAKKQKQLDIDHAKTLIGNKVSHMIRQVGNYIAMEINKIESQKDADNLRKRIGNGIKWTDKNEAKMLTPEGDVKKELWVKIYQSKKDEIIEMYKTKSNEIWGELEQNIDVHLENKEEAKKLMEAAQKEREQKEKERLEEEKKSMDVEAVLAEIDDKGPIDESIKVKKKINILNMSGAVALVNFWYKDDPEAEKQNWDRRTFAQCKRYAEKRANSDDVLFEHDGFEWIDDVKAK